MSKAHRQRIALILRQALKDRGMEDTHLAETSGVHITLVRRYLDAEVAVGAKNGGAIAKALGLTLETVLYGEAAA